MIIDIGTGVDESVVKWKHNDKDKWHDADIDELIHLYESIVHCKDCRWYGAKYEDKEYDCPQGLYAVCGDDFCSHGERREE